MRIRGLGPHVRHAGARPTGPYRFAALLGGGLLYRHQERSHAVQGQVGLVRACLGTAKLQKTTKAIFENAVVAMANLGGFKFGSYKQIPLAFVYPQ